MKLATPDNVQKLRTALYERAKREPRLRFYSLYDKVYRMDVLAHAYALCRANKGAAGPDGITFEDIEEGGGPASMLARLAEELTTRQYKPGPVRGTSQRRTAGSGRWASPRSLHTAASPSSACESVLVTHPFHPLAGQRLSILFLRRCRSIGRAYVCDGPRGNVTLPEEFTDRGLEPARCPLTLDVLIELARAVAAVKKGLDICG